MRRPVQSPASDKRGVARRLGAALLRYGPLRVARFGADLVRREGLGGALAYAHRRAGLAPKPKGFVLDSESSIAEPAWRDWVQLQRSKTGPVSQAAPKTMAGGGLAFVIDVTQGGDVDLTRDSIRAVAPSALVAQEPGAWGAAERPDWIVFLKAGDQLTPDFAQNLTAVELGVELATFDLMRRHAGRVYPIFLPGPNATLARAAPPLYARFAWRGDALPHAPGVQSNEVRLAHWLTVQSPQQLRRRWRHLGGLPWVEIPNALAASHPAFSRRLANAAPQTDSRKVSVVICTKDKGHLLRQLVRGLLATQKQVLDVVIVSNNTRSPHALAALDDLATDSRVRVIRQDGPFNFSKLANTGARETHGDVLLFLNDDIAPVTEDWLARLLARLDQPGVGVVGPLLLYPNETVQHAGMYLGYRGVAGHMLRHARPGRDDYLGLAGLARETDAVTGAVLLTRRATFDQLGGFDLRLATFLQDVDYCLRVNAGGLLNVFDPSAVLIHMESASINELSGEALHTQRPRELAHFQGRWGKQVFKDRYFPEGFNLDDEALKILAT